jgi:hypothetical protein
VNYEISQILNFESCQVGIPNTLIGQAAVAVITENWQNNIDLAEAITTGKLDITAETASVNQSLEEAGCKTRAEESDVQSGLNRWMEMETLKGNI